LSTPPHGKFRKLKVDLGANSSKFDGGYQENLDFNCTNVKNPKDDNGVQLILGFRKYSMGGELIIL